MADNDAAPTHGDTGTAAPDATVETPAAQAAEEGSAVEGEGVAAAAAADDNSELGEEPDILNVPDSEPGAKGTKAKEPMKDMPNPELLLAELEAHADEMVHSLMHISGGLRVNFHALSNICKQYITAHQLAVEGIGSTVDRSLSAMSSLMVGCEQISENMPPVDQLVEQLQNVKTTLDILESSVNERA